MAQTIVLIRHGEAKNKRLGETDFDRELTSRGAAALERSFPEALARVPREGKRELWVSPAKRAQQTAAIANKTLGISEADTRLIDALYEQDQRRFLAELAMSDADVVVAVGHIPFMEDACALLCGSWLRFSTGSVAAIELGDKPGDGTLLWFEEGPEV